MMKVLRSILSFVLLVSLLLTANISAFAAAGELYLSDLRIVYAKNYNEAKSILSSTNFKDYTLLNENLNVGTDETGVWLAYKTTSNIEEAITDLAIMQMQGGYQEGNYQEMIKKSYNEYLEMSENYLQAVEYFVQAYDAGHFLAKVAYRQLNLYTSITDKDLGIKIPSFDGEKLGDIFYDGIDSAELATIFMQGNSYALDNIRSLLSMGVAYNEDGMTYLEKVAAAAQEMTDDPEIFSDEEYESILPIISVTITGFQNVFEELAAHEADLNYEDENYTEEELSFLETYGIAKMMRDVAYLDGKTLYEFCLDYDGESNDYSTLYPLAVALNEGQVAMTKVAHYQDVVRYSMPAIAEEEIDAEIAKLEEKYGENPFNIYTGVDRSVFTGTFALTNAAYRADAYTDTNSLLDTLFGEQLTLTVASIGIDAVGLGIMAGAAYHYNKYDLPARSAAINDEVSVMMNHHSELLGKNTLEIVNNGVTTTPTYDKFLSDCLTRFYQGQLHNGVDFNDYYVDTLIKKLETMSTYDKYLALWDELADEAGEFTFTSDNLATMSSKVMSPSELAGFKALSNKVQAAGDYLGTEGHRLSEGEIVKMATDKIGSGISWTTTLLYIAGGIVMLSSAIVRGIAIYNHYHPDYDDIPTSMVDMIDTVDGDRYIKYDVVYEAETREKGVYAAGDLNAFSAQRWNALYYTKSYEAGKPLLADEFIVSNSNNKPKSGYSPVRRFGEVVSYNLNKYNFDYDTNIYLSVKQSKNDKSAIADVPQVVGSIFAGGLWVLVGSIGAVVGIGATLGMQAICKKKTVPTKKD